MLKVCSKMYVLLEVLLPFQKWKNSENRFRFDKVNATSRQLFFWHIVYSNGTADE